MFLMSLMYYLGKYISASFRLHGLPTEATVEQVLPVSLPPCLALSRP